MYHFYESHAKYGLRKITSWCISHSSKFNIINHVVTKSNICDEIFNNFVSIIFSSDQLYTILCHWANNINWAFFSVIIQTPQIRPKWPNTTIFGNFQQTNTVSEINSKVLLFLELEFQKLEFLISFATIALLSWICAIKKNFAVLELGKLEYHLHSTRIYQARVPF